MHSIAGCTYVLRNKLMTLQARSKNDRLFRDAYEKVWYTRREARKVRDFLFSHREELEEVS